MNHIAALQGSPDVPLTILHAKVHGQGGQEQLARALSRVPLDGLGLARDEFLYVPHLKSPAALQRFGNGHRFAQSVSRSLHDVLGKALINPDYFTGNKSICRFSSNARFTVWLLGGFLENADDFHEVLTATTGYQDARVWWRASVICDGALMVHVCNVLAHQRKAAAWISRLSSDDLNIAGAALQRQYDISVQPDVDAENGYRASRAHDKTTSHETPDPLVEQSLLRDPQLIALPPRHRRLAATAIYLGHRPARSRGASLKRFIEAFVFEKPGSGISADDGPAALSSAAEGNKIGEGKTPFSDASVPLSKGPPATPDANNRMTEDDSISIKLLDETGDGLDIYNSEEPELITAPETVKNIFHQDIDEQTFVRTPNAENGMFSWDQTQGFESDYCGLFFVINALLRLGLIRDFTYTNVSSDELSPFAIINSLGQYWFGSDYTKSQLCHVLNAHSGRFSPRRRFNAVKYLESEPVGDKTILARDGRSVTVWHADGFPLLDIEWQRHKRGQRAVLSLLKSRTGSSPQGRLVRAQGKFRLPQNPADRWTACLAKFLEWRLANASSEFAISPDSLMIPGRVRMIDEKISIHMALENLPIAIRMVGLDRDPGWIVGEGRSLAFIFE